ncbi:MAG: hypothetical protein J6T24_05375 [Clostridia bacterium]|nr:hypothetical protein [Clostridia bacterium]
MKYQYTYMSYQGYPEATEISRDREKNKPLLFSLNILLGIAGIIGFIADFKNSWYIGLLLIAIASGGIFYLLKYYDVVTQRKIARAIKRRDDMRKKGRGVL